MAPDLDSTFGAMFIGLLFATFFQGALSVQTYIYYENYPEDPRLTKILVGLIWILDMAHLVLISHATHHYLVTHWGNEQALLYATQELDLHLIFVGVATILCQAFYLHRVWIFSEGNYFLLIFLVAGCLSTLVLDVVMTIMISQGDRSVNAFTMFGYGIVALFTISAASYIFSTQSNSRRNYCKSSLLLPKAEKSGFKSVVAVMCLLAAIHFSLGRMYTNALLATLVEFKRTPQGTFQQ
ncbi:hypothetical protein BDQ17DRAFT_1328794 [Cyathus striatus]|nr:hypothetical protein BDQ17DRAFT_1328794 [Cyathus striatus]